MAKEIWKIRLKPDGTWENVYRDTFYEMNPKSLVEWNNSIFVSPTEFNRFLDKREEYLEAALDKSDYRDAKMVIDWVKNK